MSSDTNWAVLTGGGWSGKSSLAEYFQADGQEVIPEAAGQYIEVGSSEDIPPNVLQNYGTGGPIPELDIQMEARRDPEEPVLLDRSLGDSLAFIDKFIGDAPQHLVEEASNRYDTVFLMEQLEYEPDKTRTENIELSREMHEHLGDFYSDVLDYDVVDVPEASIQERARIVAENSEMEEPTLDLDFPDYDEMRKA